MAIEKRVALAGRPSIIKRGSTGKIRLSGHGWSLEISGSNYDLSDGDKAALADTIDSFLSSLVSPEEADDGR